MSSPLRRIQIRIMKRRGVEKVPCPYGRTQELPGAFDDNGKPVEVPVYVWPALIPKVELPA